MFLNHLLLEYFDFLPETIDLFQVKECVPYPVFGVVIFNDIIEGSIFQEADGCGNIFLARDHYHLNAWVAFPDLFQHFVTGHVGQRIIECYNVRIFVEMVKKFG